MESRAAGPLVKVNCAAIPETLLESELFGHEKGAFTGAVAQRIGRFEQANGGTIFLDEIAEMSPPASGQVAPRHAGRTLPARRLEQRNPDQRPHPGRHQPQPGEKEVKAGRFREDLFYRLNVVELNIPPLRERPEDILPLASGFIAEFTEGPRAVFFAVADCLERYPWPGNVRELRNAMERAALLSRGELILPEHLPRRMCAALRRPPPAAEESADPQRLEEIERQAVSEALRQHDFNRTETAKALGISRRLFKATPPPNKIRINRPGGGGRGKKKKKNPLFIPVTSRLFIQDLLDDESQKPWPDDCLHWSSAIFDSSSERR